MKRRATFVRAERGDARASVIVAFMLGGLALAAVLSSIALAYWPAVAR